MQLSSIFAPPSTPRDRRLTLDACRLTLDVSILACWLKPNDAHDLLYQIGNSKLSRQLRKDELPTGSPAIASGYRNTTITPVFSVQRLPRPPATTNELSAYALHHRGHRKRGDGPSTYCAWLIRIAVWRMANLYVVSLGLALNVADLPYPADIFSKLLQVRDQSYPSVPIHRDLG